MNLGQMTVRKVYAGNRPLMKIHGVPGVCFPVTVTPEGAIFTALRIFTEQNSPICGEAVRLFDLASVTLFENPVHERRRGK